MISQIWGRIQIELISMLQKQIELQQKQFKSQQEAQAAQMKQILQLVNKMADPTTPAPATDTTTAVPPFQELAPRIRLFFVDQKSTR